PQAPSPAPVSLCLDPLTAPIVARFAARSWVRSAGCESCIEGARANEARGDAGGGRDAEVGGPMQTDQRVDAPARQCHNAPVVAGGDRRAIIYRMWSSTGVRGRAGDMEDRCSE